MFSYILAIFCGLVILGIDQLTKYLVVTNFEVFGEAARFLDGFINFKYVTNTGVAWGVMGDYTWLILSLSAILMIVCFTLLVKLGKENKFVFWAITFVIAGGLGNMVDRIFRDGKVVDFLQFDFWESFPVFNIADCSIVLGAFLLIAYFVYDSIKDSKAKKLAAHHQKMQDNE